MRHVLACLLLAFALSGPAGAQEALDVEEEIALQQCLEAARDAGQPGHDCIGVVAEPCAGVPGNDTTAGMVACYGRELGWWDGLLNGHYSALREALDEAAFAHLRDTQRAWLAFRDLHCGMPDALYPGGSIARVSAAQCMLEESGRRAVQLGTMLDEAAL